MSTNGRARFTRAGVLAAVGAATVACVATTGCSPTYIDPPVQFDAGSGGPFTDAGPDSGRLPAPDWGTAVAPAPPPPITGGTLLISRDGRTAIAADPERDTIALVDLANRALLAQVALRPGDAPFRAVEDEQGRVHVTLRGGGAVVSIDPDRRVLVDRREVCAQPRGIAYDPNGAMLHVACAGGELVSMAAAFGPPLRTVQFGPDLRDVVVEGDHLLVSRFRTADLLRVETSSGLARATVTLPPLEAQGARATIPYAARVAWRTVPLPVTGGMVMVHQRARTSPIPPANAYYAPQPAASACGEAVANAAVTVVRAGEQPGASPIIPTAVLPVDVAVSPDGARVAIAAAGNWVQRAYVPQVYVYDIATLQASGSCAPQPISSDMGGLVAGQVTSVAFLPDGRVAVQTREPPAVQVLGEPAIALPGDSHADVGHALFHGNAGGFIACASCHPEGDDDGHVWHFLEGARRTQPIRGGVLETAPLHWDGQIASFTSLMEQVFVGRMGGSAQDVARASSLGNWVNQLPAAPTRTPTDPDAVARGRALFFDSTVGCTNCHTGPHYTNNQTVNVGTWTDGRGGTAPGMFQVPTLRGLYSRAPYMHDGCAATLRDRFTDPTCGGGDSHGHTSQLTGAQVDDLIAFLQTL